ncbi:glycosyltransferase [Oenococcus oeni]
MIPKTVHYIWFGARKKPGKVITEINNWERLLPDYQIKEWNEFNYDLTKIKSSYVQQAIEKEMWAFVSDYVRLDILNKEGGIYLDTDVELLNSFNDLLNDKSFIGRESKYAFSTSVIGSEANQPWLNDLLMDYEKRLFINKEGHLDKTPNSKYILSFFMNKYKFDNLSQDRIRKIHNIVIYPACYFSPINFANQKKKISNKTIAIHHYSGTWKTPTARFKDCVLIFLSQIFGEKMVEMLKKRLK